MVRFNQKASYYLFLNATRRIDFKNKLFFF